MHIEKNICDSIIMTLLDIQGETKDHINAHYDLQDMGIRKDLHLRDIGKDRAKFSAACFSMNAHEKSIFYGVFKHAKLPDKSASNISKCVHATINKISGYKSYDAHLMLLHLLPMAIQLHDMDYLKVEVVEILCQLEMIFPPRFFDIMIHLLIHLPNEVRLGGLVQF